ncbi:MAG: YitT family protein [Bacteroidia bacterium]|nr:YitT family protein [Bacteroidia bacterium]MBP7436452.1 YitT family protein [Bacteroidia bacterium]MBP7728227.1 YitT family protein [Bacteroidia bacterium]MBP7771408.1 YitT family protein [Bacteroidia bacterium]
MRPFHLPRSRVQRRKVVRQSLRSFVLIALGALSAFVGLKGFLLPNHLIDGGATGISILTAYGTPIPLPLLILVINIPFIFMGWRQVGLGFAFRASGGIILLSILLSLLTLPTFTSDRLLIAVFGGFFLGAGIGLSIRGGGVIDGTEVLALYISRKTGLTIGDFILVINILIFLTAAWLINLESAMYSILTYLIASRTVDFLVHGLEEYTGVTIVSDRSEEIRKALIYQVGHGVTILKGKSGYGNRGDRNHEIDVIFTVVTRLEIHRLKGLVERLDPKAFLVTHSINDSRGGMIRKRPQFLPQAHS